MLKYHVICNIVNRCLISSAHLSTSTCWKASCGQVKWIPDLIHPRAESTYVSGLQIVTWLTHLVDCCKPLYCNIQWCSTCLGLQGTITEHCVCKSLAYHMDSSHDLLTSYTRNSKDHTRFAYTLKPRVSLCVYSLCVWCMPCATIAGSCGKWDVTFSFHNASLHMFSTWHVTWHASQASYIAACSIPELSTTEDFEHMVKSW